MAGLNYRLLQYVRRVVRSTRDRKSSSSDTDLVMAFTCFTPHGGGQGFSFSDCQQHLPFSSWVEEDGGPPVLQLAALNDVVAFSVQ